MDWLKAIMGESLTEEHLTAIKKELPKHFALKSDFNVKIQEITDLNTQLGTANQSIKDLTATAGTSETLKADLEKITGEFDAFKADAVKREKNTEKLGKLKADLGKKFSPDAVDLLASTFKLDDLVTNEAGEIVDIESKLTALAEARPTLVITTGTGGNPPLDKNTPPVKDYSKMTDDEYYAEKA